MKKIIKNPLIILAVAIVLLLGSSVGATRAAIVYQTTQDELSFKTAEIAVQLLENDKEVGTVVIDKDTKNIPLTFGFDENNKFEIGKEYTQDIAVKNVSSNEFEYPAYVRVIVTKSWKNDNGTKNTALDPSLIKLGIAEGWVEGPSTTEQTIYYFTRPLAYDEKMTVINSLQVEDTITHKITKEDTEVAGVITTTYDYAGKSFSVEVEVDAVQTHNAHDAILGAWGVDVTVAEDGTISLN